MAFTGGWGMGLGGIWAEVSPLLLRMEQGARSLTRPLRKMGCLACGVGTVHVF